jgi:hypothetical protein
MLPAELEKLSSEVTEAVKGVGGKVIDAVVSIDRVTGPVVSLDGLEFPALINHAKPRIVYVLIARFDARTEVMDALSDLDNDDDNAPEKQDFLSHAAAKKLIAAWRHRDGDVASLTIALMSDGVLHVGQESSDWFDEFEAILESIVDGIREEIYRVRQETERLVAEEERRKTSSYVKILMEDPRFTIGRPSAAKRTLLAQRLFGDLDSKTIRAVVSQAEGQLWLEGSAQKG